MGHGELGWVATPTQQAKVVFTADEQVICIVVVNNTRNEYTATYMKLRPRSGTYDMGINLL